MAERRRQALLGGEQPDLLVAKGTRQTGHERLAFDPTGTSARRGGRAQLGHQVGTGGGEVRRRDGMPAAVQVRFDQAVEDEGRQLKGGKAARHRRLSRPAYGRDVRPL